MKTYTISYWAERNDEATDLEKDVEARDAEEAIKVFKTKVSFYKKIESVVPVPTRKPIGFTQNK